MIEGILTSIINNNMYERYVFIINSRINLILLLIFAFEKENQKFVWSEILIFMQKISYFP